MRLQGRVAIITGGAQGIGRAYATAFAEEGAKVVVADRAIEPAEQVAASIREAGGDAIAVEVDVTSREQTVAMVEAAVAAFGTVDILINNAAIFSALKMKPFDEISADEWDVVVDVNARGTFFCCQAVAPIMRKAHYGRIVNISSSVVMTGRANYAHYVASKGAVFALTHALATELGVDNITVNSISPHGIVTEVARDTITDAQWDGIISQQALKRKGDVSDMVGATIFLASDDSKYITGQTMGVDAGLRYT